MKKLIAAALCITAIGAQALEIKGLTPGDEFDCNQIKPVVIPLFQLKLNGSEIQEACKRGDKVTGQWEDTFLGHPVTFTVSVDKGRILELSLILDDSEMPREAIAAFSEKYGKPISGSEDLPYYTGTALLTERCDFHRWQRDGKQLEITACKVFGYPLVTRKVNLTKFKAPTYKKSDI